MQPPRAGLDVDQIDEAAPVVACLLIGGLVVSVRVTIASLVVAAGILSSAGLSNSVAAAPLVPATASIVSANPAIATQVRWRGHGGGGAAAAAGLMTGLIIGGLVAAPHYYEEPYPYYRPYGYYAPGYAGPIGYGAPGWEAYCVSRYRSFDPISGTYLGHDGRWHYCR
jgi:BA14K-like protein